MELTVTQPVFLWLLGAVSVLGIFALLALVIILFQVVALLRLINEKAVEVGVTIDEVRATVHKASETVNDTKERFANMVTLVTSAAGITRMVETVRDVWGKRSSSAKTDDIFDGDTVKK